MNLGDILVAKGLVSAEDIKRALEHQRENGGRLGGSLVALGMLTKEQIDRVLEEAPQAPLTAAATGIDPALLLELVMKGMHTENLELASQIAEALKLSSTIVNPLLNEAKERKFVEALAVSVRRRSHGGIAPFTDPGRARIRRRGDEARTIFRACAGVAQGLPGPHPAPARNQ